MDEQDNDPFHGLEDWAHDVERRATRAHRWGRLRRPRATFAVPRRRFSALKKALWIAAAVGIAAALSLGIPYLQSGSVRPDRHEAVRGATGPFAGTAAETYPVGEAGISLPAASAVGGFTPEQVDADLQQVRRALVAGRLDETMLVGHDASGFLALLAPAQHERLAQWFAEGQELSVATWIDPAVKLDPAQPPRVSGQVTLDTTDVNGRPALRVTTNFVWVYAFDVRQDLPIAAVHDNIEWEFRPDAPGMWLASARSYQAGMDCDASAKGLLAPGHPHPAGRVEAPDAALRPDHTMAVTGTCPHASASPTT